jgi:hypothetical protein
MDAITFLIKQHRQIEQALEDALKAERPEQRTTAPACRRRSRQARRLGKQVFYPAVKARRTEDILLESLEEHLSLKRLLADLLELPPSADTWQPKLKVLDEQTRHHHEEEEENLFPKVRKICSELDLSALGDELQACQARLVRAGEARSAAIENTDEAVPLK